MTNPGTAEEPVRVAIIGSGPAGFYVAEQLNRKKELVVEVDMYDRLPTPYGLVRFGVAPDHQKIKNVIKTYEKTASNPTFRFYGNVDFGTQITLTDLQQHYHQICFATGAQSDRRMGIPGEDLERSHAATEFVAWYNGHPDYRDRQFDLSVERVAVVGVGNVAVDVARMLCRTPDELAQTDIADYALEALAESKVREVYMLGRRGPAQAAFTNPEAKELGELPGADIAVLPNEVELDPLSKKEVAKSQDRALKKRLEILQDFSRRKQTNKHRKLTIRFLVSPVELLGNAAGQVVGMKLVKNSLAAGKDGRLRPRPTEYFEELPAQLVFRSVGYQGVALPELPFDESKGVVPNEKGRIIGPDTGSPVTGLYVSGWIKRGPTGVIGTNKPDAAETVAAMVEDLENGRVLRPTNADRAAVESLISARQPHSVSFDDWRRLDELEVSAGEPNGRPRVKLTSIDEMLAALGRSGTPDRC